MVYVFLRGRTKNRFFCPSPQKTKPQLFLTPRVKRKCENCGLPFAGSGLAEGLYIPAVVGGGRENSVGTPGTRAEVSAEGVRSGTANSAALPNLFVASLADRPGGREAEMALE